MPKSTITVQTPLHKLSERKKDRIDTVIHKQGEIAEEIVKFMPSIPPSRWGGGKNDSVFFRWVKKKFPNRNDLRAHDAYQVAYKISSNYESWRSNGYEGSRPSYTVDGWNCFRICNCNNSIKYEKNNGKWGVKLSLEPRNPEWFSLKVGDYQEKHLEKAKELQESDKKGFGFGEAEVVRRKDRYILNQTINIPVPKKHTPKTRIGIDLGLINIATVVAIDEDGNYIEGPFENGSPIYSGGKVSHYRERMEDVRNRLQEAGEGVDKVKDYLEKYPEHINHIVSRRIVDFAKELEKPIIKFENLKGIRKRINEREPSKYHKRRLNRWSFGQLKNFTQYKAEIEGIPVVEVNPKNTSRECPNCGEISEENRDGTDFECVECGYENHADFVGAWNIADSKR